MKQFRIVTNGELFRIEQKGFFGRWETWWKMKLKFIGMFIAHEFPTHDEAVGFVRKHHGLSVEIVENWVLSVPTSITVTLPAPKSKRKAK